VALACFNGAGFIEDQLESIERQTLRPLEIVVCDDGSSDDTPALVQAFAARSRTRVVLHRNPENLGFAANFLRAAALCAGDLISFCDQDDVWRDDKLERCVRVFAEHPGLRMALHSGVLVDVDGRSLGVRYPEVGRSRVESGIVADRTLAALGTCMVFDRHLLDLADTATRPASVYAAHGQVNHDQLVHFLAAAHGDIALIDLPLIRYRQHASNAVGARDVTVRGRVGTAFRLTDADYAAATRHYLECADYLDGLSQRSSSGEVAARLHASARAHRRLAHIYGLRRGLLEADRSRRGRAGIVVRLAARGAYRSRGHGGLGWRAAAKDSLSTVLRRY
jgi:glycosyltransferase involved in cell wall biosynthesis